VTPRRLLAALVMAVQLTAAAGSTPASSSATSPDMVLIPAGDFLMGSPAGAGGFDDESPQRLVYLSPFWIDRREVTNGAYERFVRATGHRPPANPNPAATLWEHGAPLAGIADHPVVNVSWDDALAYCRWAGKRLPTEAEWEKAARGTDGRRYPWGDAWDPSRANSASYWVGRTVEFKDREDWLDFWVRGEGARIAKERGVKGEVLTLPVGSLPAGASPYGPLDMAGNASEWVADWYEPYAYLKAPPADPQGPDGVLLKVVRGGSWLKPAKSMRTTDRDYGFPADRASGTGFRCARDDY